MLVRYTSTFKRMYRRLTPEQQDLSDKAVQIFIKNPFHPQLRNHKLLGSKKSMRAISAGYDLRILYIEKDGHAVIFLLTIGTHDKVY